MILKKVGNTKLLCEKKDGTEKWFKATPAVITFAKNKFKAGDSIKAEFNDKTYVIEKVTSLDVDKGVKSYSGKSEGAYEKMVERSVYASVATIVSGLGLKEPKAVKKAIEELFEQGISLVRGEEVKPKDEEETSEEPEENSIEDEPVD